MRTKALLGLAALAVSALSVWAQANVYSLNVVGYANVTVPANNVGGGFYIACNPLQVNDAVNGNNALASVIPPASVPQGTLLYRYDNGTGQFAIAAAGQDDNGNPAWDQPWSIAPGEGFWVKNPTAAAINITFVGEVLQGTLNNPIPAGFSLRGSQVPQSGDLATVLGYPAVVDGTTIYMWNPATGYTICNRQSDDNGNPAWDNIPSPAVGQGFWARQTAATTWTRTFNVQ